MGFDELRGAILGADWPAALATALAWWRETREPALANLVDAIGARCELPAVPRSKQLHAWWIEQATAYDPVVVTRLAALATTRASGSDHDWSAIRARWSESPPIQAIVANAPNWFAARYPVDHMNALERAAAMFAWPDDPRVAPFLAELLVTAPLHIPDTALRALYRVVGDKLVVLRDVRVVPQLEICIAEPRGDTEAIRAIQVAVARDALDQLAEADAHLGTLELAPRIAQLAALVTPAIARAAHDLDALWAEVAAHPDDDGPRLVLADALAEAGDSRGELITLQCADTVHHHNRAGRLLRTEWARWLGDLALIVTRKGTEFRHGMLETVRVGQTSTPDWAWDKIAGHRELATVHTVRPGDVVAKRYARFVEHCVHVRELAVNKLEMLRELVRGGKQLPITTLEIGFLVSNGRRYDTIPAVTEVFTSLDKIAPALEVIVLDNVYVDGLGNALRDLVAKFPARHPRLRAIRIVKANLRPPAAAAELAGTPLVELV